MGSSPDAQKRWEALERAGFNVALVPACAVDAELSTDLPAPRALDRGSAPGLDSAHRELGAALAEVLGLDCWRPVHLGRGAEAVAAAAWLGGAGAGRGRTVVANEIYVTGRWSVERCGGRVVELPPPPAGGGGVARSLDLEALEDALRSGDVAWVHLCAPRVLLTPAAATPVTLGEVRAVRDAIDRRAPGTPLVLDAARLFENAARARRLEPGLARSTVAETARRFAECADLLVMSGRKDLGAEHGGVLAARTPDRMRDLERACDLLEGGRLSGGLDPLQLASLAHGLREAATGRRVESGIARVDALAARLRAAGTPVLASGCGALYLDAAVLLPRVPLAERPAQTLLQALFLVGGIRGIGAPSERGDQVVRLAARAEHEERIEATLGALRSESETITSGLRFAGDRGPFLDRMSPVEPGPWRDLPALAPATGTPGIAGGGSGFANAAWPELESALRGRMALEPEARVLPAPPERGPLRLLAEAWTRPEAGPRQIAARGVLAELVRFWEERSAQPAGAVTGSSPRCLRVVRPAELEAAREESADLLAVDLGALESWPAPGDPFWRALAGSAVVWWATDPAGDGAPGSFLAFPRETGLYRAVRDRMLFAVGSLHDGGLSARAMTRLASRLRGSDAPARVTG